jgi:hypothetical protein
MRLITAVAVEWTEAGSSVVLVHPNVKILVNWQSFRSNPVGVCMCGRAVG